MVYKIKNVSADNIKIQDKIMRPGDVVTDYSLDAYNNMLDAGYLQLVDNKAITVDVGASIDNQLVHNSEATEQKIIYKTIYKEKPIEKIVYIDKPIYIEKQVEKPVEKVVYKDKLVITDMLSMTLSELQEYYKDKFEEDILNSFNDAEELIAYIINNL
jgi:hypothetical protein